ncbi:MAG: hypothetical protein Q8P61_08625 [Candidatus Nanopelagicales bacterium]|nr:hypothetical protein [Candidatus Nanopelagicales bacterium]
MTRLFGKRAIAVMGAAALGVGTLMAAAPAQADATTKYGVAATGHISASVLTLPIQGGEITGDDGTGSGEVTIYMTGSGQVPLAVAKATITPTKITADVTASGHTVAISLDGAGYVYSGSMTILGIPATVTDLTLVPPGPGPKPTPGPTPSGKATQVLQCAGLPAKVKKRGVTVLRSRACKTNTGEKVHVQVLGSHHGKVMGDRRAKRFFRVSVNKRGRVSVRTFGKTFDVHVLERAHETATYHAYFAGKNVHL